MGLKSLFFQEEEKFEQLSFDECQADVLSLKSNKDKGNQDAIGLFDLGKGRIVILVCDGMGGHSKGELASKSIYEAFKKILSKVDQKTNLRECIISAIEEADQEIKSFKAGAGSTVVAALIESGHAQVFHSGDSTGFVLGGRGKLKYKTIEHSPVGHAIESGIVDEKLIEEEVQLRDNIVSNGIGFSPMRLEISQKIELSDGDILVLATDGVTGHYSESEMINWASSGSFEERVKKIHSALIENDGEKREDDSSIILFKFNAKK